MKYKIKKITVRDRKRKLSEGDTYFAINTDIGKTRKADKLWISESCVDENSSPKASQFKDLHNAITYALTQCPAYKEVWLDIYIPEMNGRGVVKLTPDENYFVGEDKQSKFNYK